MLIVVKHRGCRKWGWTPWVTDVVEVEGSPSAIRNKIKKQVEDADGDGIRSVQFKIFKRPSKHWKAGIQEEMKRQASKVKSAVEELKKLGKALKV